MLKDLSLEKFTDAVASEEAVPGGGSAAALAGALAAALAGMVGALTLKKEAFADVAPMMTALREEADQLRTALLNGVDRDADSYRGVLAAFRLPKSTDDEKQARSAAIQTAFTAAANVPLETAQTALKIMELAEKAVSHGNPDMITDAGVAILLARSAALGALMNVQINLGSLKDAALVADLRGKVADLKAAVLKKEQDALSFVWEKLDAL